MTVDSGSYASEFKKATAPTVFGTFVAYSAVEPSEMAYRWIQEPIALQILGPAGSIIDGIYVQTPRRDIFLEIGTDLRRELEAWEAASDEALLNFEADCG